MFLLLILLIAFTLLTIFIAFVIGAGGAVFIIVFGDVIVCIAGLAWIIKKLFFKNNKG